MASLEASSSADAGRGGAPVHLWVVGALALLWNLMGAFDYLATQLRLDFYMRQFSPEQLQYFYGLPAWAVAGWAFGVWSSVVGSIGLLARRRWAVWAFAIAIAGMLVSALYTLALSDGADIMGTSGVVFTIVIWVVAVFLLLYSRAQAVRGLLR